MQLFHSSDIEIKTGKEYNVLTWILPGSEVDPIREATFTVSPNTQNLNCLNSYQFLVLSSLTDYSFE